MHSALAEAFTHLPLEPSPARVLGILADPTGEPEGSPEDEHHRWRLYESAAAVPAAVPWRDGTDPADVGPEAVSVWSDWLQLRIVDPTRSREMLKLLAEHGRTKRIRRLAREAQG